VADHTYIAVKRFGGTQKFAAQVLAVAHDCDLVEHVFFPHGETNNCVVQAVLTVTEDEFWSAITPLEFGEIPVLVTAIYSLISRVWLMRFCNNSIYKILWLYLVIQREAIQYPSQGGLCLE